MKTPLLATLALVSIALLPTTASAPVLCQGTCTIAGGSTHFTPPVVAVESGSTVAWVPDDGNTHANTDTGTADTCFFAPYNPDSSAPVRFDIVDDVVRATTNPGTVDETTADCGNAAALPNGSFVVQYFCVLHPVLMKGALVIVPETA